MELNVSREGGKIFLEKKKKNTRTKKKPRLRTWGVVKAIKLCLWHIANLLE